MTKTIRAVLLAAGCALLANAAHAETRLDITKGWQFRPDGQDAGMSERWYAPAHDDSAWATLDAGAKWEDQGFPDLDGYAWYRRWVEIPAAWAGKKVWLALGGINDAGLLFCNGEYVASYGEETRYSAARTAAAAEIGSHLAAGERNLIALRVYDWALSGGLWQPPCLLTVDPESMPTVIQPQCIADYAKREAVLRILQAGLDKERPNATYRVAIIRPGAARPVARRTIPIPREESAVFASFRLPAAGEPVDYRVHVEARDADGEVIVGTQAETPLHWPGRPRWPAEYDGVKILNNFAAELLNAPCPAQGRLQFTNPRTGWVFFSLGAPKDAGPAADEPRLLLDGEADPLLLRAYAETGALEAMRFLAAGRHAIAARNAASRRLVVRAVPELGYSYYPTQVHVPEQGAYDWAFLERCVLPHVNMLVSPGDGPPEEHLAQWVREGRHWVNAAGLPGLHAAKPAPAQQVYDYWMARVGTTSPRFKGLIIDEFSHVEPQYYREWTDALARLSDDPLFAGKTFYAWCGEMYEHRPADEFARLVRARDHRFAWEQYLSEPPTEDAARFYLLRRYVANMTAWQEQTPDVARYMQMCLGFFTTPPATLNTNPGINFNVLLDRQFRIMAADPAYADLFGVMQWTAAYADEETLRWGYRLFRHYCIEGSREPLSRDPLLLPHLRNPDFAEGHAHWRVEPAAEGSIAVRKIIGFSRLEGRYPPTSEGERFLWMKRSAQRPNRVRQAVTDLEPGRLYSVKLISADLRHLDLERRVAVSLEVDGGDVLDGYSYQSIFRCREHKKVAACAGLDQVFMNYHRLVFRAKDSTAALAISDWASPTDPGGMPDQELACNFVELQPYYAGR